MAADTPQSLGLPHESWRDGQRLAIAIARAGTTAHTILQAPTGTGKSAVTTGIAALDARDSLRDVILTGTTGLQDQYAGEYQMLTDVRGMSHYDCLAASEQFKDWFKFVKSKSPIMCDRGPCRSKQRCELHDDGCLYFDQVRAFQRNPVGLTNYAYALSARRFGGGIGPVHRLLCDEAHELPEQLMSACSIELPTHVLPEGAEYAYPADRKNGRRWAGPGVPAIKRAVDRWRIWAAEAQERHQPSLGDQEDARYRKVRLRDALEQLQQIDHTWAWDRTHQGITFEPTIPADLLPLLVSPDERTKAVYLSATITPALLTMMGISRREITFYSLKSRFEARYRPVYICGRTRVDFRMSDADWLDVVALCDGIIKPRLDRKGLVHCQSFERGRKFLDTTRHRDRVILHQQGEPAAEAVERFRMRQPPAILVSPSITTGFNFPYTAAEYQILLKMPFLDTRSNLTRARVRATDGYQDHVVSQKVVQTCGRINRADDDQGETFVVDGHAQWLLGRYTNEGLLADWFVESLRYDSPRYLPDPPRKL